MRIDSHQHFWRYRAAGYPWIGDHMAGLRHDFLPADLKPELDAVGFDGSILVQVRQTVDDTRWMLELADRHAFILGVVGWVDLRSPTVVADLEEIARHPKLVGARHVVQDEPDGFLLGAAFCRGVAALQRVGLTYDILVYERQLAEVAAFAARFPAQPFVLDHVGKPEIRSGRVTDWRRHLRALARLPNVVCKLSGLVTEADWTAWTRDQIRPYLETAIECFGPDRLMIGSDWPVCTLAATYRQTMALVMDEVAGWPAADRDAVLGGTAMRVYGLARR
jgi:L-fuconolactonase